MNMEQQEINLKVMVGIMQGSIDSIQSTLLEIKKSIYDLRSEITCNYVSNAQLQLELKNIRESYEPTKKTVNDVVSQVLKYVIGAGLGFLVAKSFV